MATSKRKSQPKRSLKAIVQDIVDQKTVEVMKQLPDRVEKVIDNSIMSLIGINAKGYGNYEIDHCNGRWNLFSEVLKAQATKEVADIIKNLKVKFNVDEFKVAFQREYHTHLSYRLKYEAQQLAKELAEQYVKEHIAELVPKKLAL